MRMQVTKGNQTHYVFLVVLSAIVFGSGLLALGRAPAADGIVPATDAPKPLAPEESRKCFKLPEGFRIELVAAEPMLAEPTRLPLLPFGNQGGAP